MLGFPVLINPGLICWLATDNIRGEGVLASDRADDKYYVCIVCGRKFPRGQGIVVEKAGFTLAFHSSRCASKFFRLLLERLDDSCARPAIRELIGELEEANRKRMEKRKKVI